MLASTAGGTFLSPVKGLPGASRIMKNETVISTSMVGMAESMRRMMNFSISYLLGAWWVGICLNTGRSSEWGSDAWGGFLFFVVRPLVFGVCGLLLLWSSETGFWVSDDLFADAFRGQSPRYGFYGCLNTLDGVSDGFFYCGGCGWQPAFYVCFGGRLKRDFGFQTTFVLVFFVGRAHATAVFRRPLGLARIRGQSPRYGCFSDDLLG